MSTRSAGTGSVLAEIAASQGVVDPRVLDAVRRVSRAGFVPPSYAALADWDEPVPIGHDQTTSQPSLIATMVEALRLTGSETVLEVGTGYGYQTALLSLLADRVWSIERFEDLAAVASANLRAAGIANAHVVVGDGSNGLPERAPYDAIVVCAAFPAVPSPLVEQLVLGGRLVQPIGPGGNEEVVVFEKGWYGLTRSHVLVPARFVQLIGAHGYAEERDYRSEALSRGRIEGLW